ncbi:MAG: BamA/TamA family outer membrane protein [Ferruginibacter sp.]
MKIRSTFITILLLCFWTGVALGQDSIKYSILLIGDAGEINPAQQSVIAAAVKNATPGKSIAVYLGDNIYSNGMGLNADDATKNSIDILRSEYQPFRTAGIPVYFVPGNHDWDRSGVKGYEKIIRANQFITQQQDSLLQMIPKDACPGPYEVNISDDIVLVAIDSEWWLYPFNKHTETSECECKSRSDVLEKLDDIVERNKNKILIFVSHHPFTTYGSHGGYYSLKEHIFPFTDLNKNLYIPMPVIGSLYPLLRKTFPPAEDVKNMLYKDMKESIEQILQQHPNVIHFAGHEHALQLIQGPQLQVVSGAGSKHTPVKKGKGSLFALSESGYVKADIMLDNTIRITFYSYHNQAMQQAFVYDKKFTPATKTVEEMEIPATIDSIITTLPGNYDSVSNVHRKLFGENYRKVWATEVKLPVLHISSMGLTPTERGGGFQTRSLRLQDANEKEWVIRSVDKYPDLLLPKPLVKTFAGSILKDNVTAAFPYAPMVVPVFADAVGVYHTNPAIVYIAPDKKLGSYNKIFAKTVNLFEQREPVGKSVSTLKMMDALKEDNDNAMDQQAYLTARMLDIFIGDWDRHGDQWRWVDVVKKKDKLFKPVPRDRDQVFYINRGLLPGIIALPWLQPKLQGFGSKIKNINTFSFNARFIDGLFTNQLSGNEWDNITSEVVSKLTDTLIDRALTKIPSPVYEQTHNQLAQQLKARKIELLHKSSRYFRFLNKNIDVTISDKNELVLIEDTADKKLSVSVFKLNKEREKGKLVFYRLLDPAITKELRLYLNAGEDSVVVNNNASNIKLRIIGDGSSTKKYLLSGTSKYLHKVHIYDGIANGEFSGDYNKAHLHLSNKQENTSFQVTDRYDKTIPLFNVGYNVDDGFVLGGGVKFIRQGFRKTPYASIQRIFIAHSFFTGAFRLNYNAEWLKAVGDADFVLSANIYAPDNTQNFFGRGNETVFNKTGNYKRFYKAAFTVLQAEPVFRWRSGIRNSLTIGPSIQYYHYDPTANVTRFINNTAQLHSYDSATLADDKAHAGISFGYVHDSRNSLILPTAGTLFNFQVKGLSGLNKYSKSFVQTTAELALYKPIDRKSNVVIANRLGGGYTFGKTAFYQSLFIGGHTNLLGFSQFRFAGEHMMYNNFEVRIKVADVSSYIAPGQLGLIGFYDIGRVWEKGYESTTWHQGTGGGIYFAPAQLLMLQLIAGKSKEGWYPYFTMGFRF